MALTSDFLVWGTDMGTIGYFFLEDWSLVSEFKHITGIKEMVAEATRTKMSATSATLRPLWGSERCRNHQGCGT